MIRFKFIQTVFIFLLLPFITLYYSIFMLCLKKKANPFLAKETQKKIDAKKLFAISKNISVQDVK